MNELHKSKSDPAIQGRIAAYKHGYKLMQLTNDGIGKGQWGENFFAAHKYGKAPHSAYVCIGAELGKPGLYLFLGVLYCCLRTTMTARTENPDEERIRRMLFVLVISYAVSSWMVDFQYRPTYFMFAAAAAAFHRVLSRINEQPGPETAALEPALPAWHPQLAPPLVLARAGGFEREPAPVLTREPAPAGVAEDLPAPPKPRIGWNWNRLSWVDFALTWLFTWGVMRYWSYMMLRM